LHACRIGSILISITNCCAHSRGEVHRLSVVLHGLLDGAHQCIHMDRAGTEQRSPCGTPAMHPGPARLPVLTRKFDGESQVPEVARYQRSRAPGRTRMGIAADRRIAHSRFAWRRAKSDRKRRAGSSKHFFPIGEKLARRWARDGFPRAETILLSFHAPTKRGHDVASPLSADGCPSSGSAKSGFVVERRAQWLARWRRIPLRTARIGRFRRP